MDLSSVITVLGGGATGIFVLFLIAVGVFDLILHFTGKKTISQRYHRLFPQWVDTIILCVTLVATWKFFGPVVFLPVMLGTIFGHLFWHEDKYPDTDSPNLLGLADSFIDYVKGIYYKIF